MFQLIIRYCLYNRGVSIVCVELIFVSQVGRLSRQAAEESAERRRAVQEKDTLQERLRQMECELECNRLELNNKETKINRLTCDVEEMSSEIKALKLESEEEITFLRKQIVS